MRAAVAERPGPPEVLTVREVLRPDPREGWTLVQVKAFGLNRSEIMTRLGYSPDVRFPRILGIECVGVIADSGAKLTTFHSDDRKGAAGRQPLARIVQGVERGVYHACLDRVFTLDQIAEAHRYMEANRAVGKVVVQP
jgi:NADPH:quinone reductase-like Zn-dependent oxidoreductase